MGGVESDAVAAFDGVLVGVTSGLDNCSDTRLWARGVKVFSGLQVYAFAFGNCP